MSKESYAKKILKVEANAISALLDNFPKDFDQVVDLIAENAGSSHLVTSGVGKASFVAMKSSATFASTGVPSFFLHPSEALHGDLGRFRKDDIALLVSHSGESIEVLNMLPIIKRIGCKIICITASRKSELGQYSDYVLETGKISEACPLGLAPTASAIVMLALTDALAMSVLKQRNFTSEEFALYHPAGSLGRKLTPVTEVMRKGAEHCVVSQDLLTKEVLSKISETPRRPGAASIVDKSGKLSGVFTDGDFRRFLNQGVEFLEKQVSTLMSKTPTTISNKALAQEALRIMSSKKIDQLIVVDENCVPVGMIDIQDLAEIRVL